MKKDTLQTTLAEKMDRWVYLEELASEIESLE